MEKVAQNIYVEAIQQGDRFIAFALINQAMEQPDIAKVLQK